MSWVIDEFKVKPSGFLASWRYKRVLIDENGNITNTGVPGQETMNLPCIADYRKSNRRYAPNSLITEFCNRDTFTNFRVYAQDCEPFAYVQTDLNATQCGYLTALPKPGVPVGPNPTTPINPAASSPVYNYGLYKYFSDCDVEQGNITVNIYQRDYAGVATEIDKGSRSPAIIRYEGDIDIPYGGIRPCVADISFVVNANFELDELRQGGERKFRIDILVENELKHRGFIIPDSCRQPFMPAPYPVTIRVTDGLGGLKDVTYPIPLGERDTLRQSFLEILSYCLNATNLDLDIATVVNLFADKMLTGLDNDPLAQATVNPLRLSDGNSNILTCYEVLDALCRQFSAYISQVDGKWKFQRLAELPNQVIRQRLYDENGLFRRGENVTPARTAGIGEEIEVIGNNAEIETMNAFKRVAYLLLFGNVPSVLFNGDFEQWDGFNFRYWTKYGGINISRVQRTVKGSAGVPINIDNYAMQFNEAADSGKYVEQEQLQVSKGDSVSFSFLIGPVVQRGMEFKVRVKVGDYYLFNDIASDNPDTFEWVKQLATATLYIQDNKNPLTYKLDMPDIPETGDMILQLYGFQRVSNANTYAAIWVDDISFDKNSEVEKKGINGLLSISAQLPFYTESPETIEILYGDYDISLGQVVRPDRVPSPTNENRMYAIYTTDKSFTTGWSEYGQSAAPVPIGLANARSILKMRQRPIYKFQGSFRGDNLSYSDIISIQVDDQAEFSTKQFAIISGTFDLKFKELQSAVLQELVTGTIITNDLNTPHFSAKDGVQMSLPGNIQDPSGGTRQAGIFTHEFTREFS